MCQNDTSLTAFGSFYDVAACWHRGLKGLFGSSSISQMYCSLMGHFADGGQNGVVFGWSIKNTAPFRSRMELYSQGGIAGVILSFLNPNRYGQRKRPL